MGAVFPPSGLTHLPKLGECRDPKLPLVRPEIAEYLALDSTGCTTATSRASIEIRDSRLSQRNREGAAIKSDLSSPEDTSEHRQSSFSYQSMAERISDLQLMSRASLSDPPQVEVRARPRRHRAAP